MYSSLEECLMLRVSVINKVVGPGLESWLYLTDRRCKNVDTPWGLVTVTDARTGQFDWNPYNNTDYNISHTLLGTDVQANAIQNNSPAIKSVFTKLMIFNFWWLYRKCVNLIICLLLLLIKLKTPLLTMSSMLKYII